MDESLRPYPTQGVFNSGSREAHVDDGLHHCWIGSCNRSGDGCNPVQRSGGSCCSSGAVCEDADDLSGDAKAALWQLVVGPEGQHSFCDSCLQTQWAVFRSVLVCLGSGASVASAATCLWQARMHCSLLVTHQKLAVADLQKQTGCSPKDPTDCCGKPLCASAECWAQERR